jgi:hypothetical protein
MLGLRAATSWYRAGAGDAFMHLSICTLVIASYVLRQLPALHLLRMSVLQQQACSMQDSVRLPWASMSSVVCCA